MYFEKENASSRTACEFEQSSEPLTVNKPTLDVLDLGK